MKIEKEQEGAYRRWAIDLDPWVERALVAFLLTALGGGLARVLEGPIGSLLAG